MPAVGVPVEAKLPNFLTLVKNRIHTNSLTSLVILIKAAAVNGGMMAVLPVVPACGPMVPH